MKFDLEKELLFKPAGRVELSGGGGRGPAGGPSRQLPGGGGGAGQLVVGACGTLIV